MNMRLAGFVAVFCSLASCHSVTGQLTGDPELFANVADAWRSNIEAIQTWQGKVNISMRFVDTSRPNIDMAAEFWYSKEERSLKRVVDTIIGTTIDDKPDLRRQTILRRPDAVHFVKFTFPNRGPKENRSVVTVVDSPEADRIGYTTEDFDPLIWLRCELSDVDIRMHLIYDNLEKFQKLWQENPLADVKSIEQDGDVVIYTTVMGDPKGDFDRIEFRFDLGKGGLPIKAIWTSNRPTSGTELTTVPKLVNGAWVPAESIYEYRESLSSARDITVNWLDIRVNEELPAGIFDPANLEMIEGDLINDARTGDSVSVGNSSNVPDKTAERSSLNFGTVLAVAASAAIALIALVMVKKGKSK